jgi:competence protein ComEA
MTAINPFSRAIASTSGSPIALTKLAKSPSMGNSKPPVMAPKATATKTVSVNKGSSADLQKVKGIGPVTAQKIITNRPYKTLDDLVTKKVFTPSQLKTLQPSLSL